ncbi:MAG: TldD/PmbA family protein [Elusimicrobiales bacterium]|nr:TldD/PmbA family protein [Elusimicrobiales bacterium]
MESVISKIFEYTSGFYTHIIYNASLENLTRFGDNEISQNVSRKDMIIEVRIIYDNKAVKFTISKFDDDSIKNAVEKAKEKLRFSKPLEFVPYPTKTLVKFSSLKYFDEKITQITPQIRAKRIKNFLSFCNKTSRLAYGIISDFQNEIIIRDSYGLNQKAVFTGISYEITVNRNGGYGKAQANSWKDDIDYERINQIALRKSDSARRTTEIKPGKYKVILEPLACVELIGYMGYLGFNALSYYENRSFVSNNLGKKVLSDKLTIIEDPISFPFSVMPFDFEGYPRERVVLVENGVIKELVTDKKTAHLTGFKYNGHSLFEPNAYGAIPVAMSVEGGKRSINEIISDTDYGILVTELHYVNALKPKTIELTGMTRNGTFLIKDGKIVSAIKNMRFTQSIVEAFSNIEELSQEREVYDWWNGGIYSPAIKISDFNFSSSTEF